ncbi:hypothetical protein, partial [uncultured Prochlorococcus sp.]|uniref:hypothetical protein n=1 Tax=uncultured Prochlorococcus sp. TaxID=159733 RepID=UPI0025838CE0
GSSVSLSDDGNTLVVGASGWIDYDGYVHGEVRIYENNSGTWQQIGSTIDDISNGDKTGQRTSISGDGTTLAVSSWSSGLVRIYERSGSSWNKTKEFSGSSGFGYSVSLSEDGSVLGIGSLYKDNEKGSVHVYKNNSGTWESVGQIDGEANYDRSGSSVEISDDGSTIAIGAPWNDGGGNKSGHVRVYQIISNTGSASFSISGTTQVGQTLSLSESSSDPDGTGLKDYNYSWQSSSDGTTWSQIGQAFASGYEPYTTKSSTTAGETLTTEVGSSITLNANGTISISGTYTNGLNADQSTALAGNNFTKIYAGGYGHLAGQRSDGSLLVIGYSVENESTIYNLLNNSFTDIKFNYAAGGAKNSSNEIITWGHSGYYDSLKQQYTDNFSTYTLTSTEEGKKVRAVITYSDGSDFTESVTTTAVDIKTDDGEAVFAISGTTQLGQALSITESTADPDGTGTLSYVWQSSPDETAWTQIGSDSTYTITSSEEDKKVRAILSYTDDQGFSESVTTSSVDIKTIDDGDAVFAISGTTQIGQSLSITESTADPDGTGTLSYVWQSSSDETTWSQIGTDSTYTLTSSEEGKKIRAIISYTDNQGFAESVTTSSIDLINDGDATFTINSSGNKLAGDNLSITESTADPDGTGTLSYVWQSSSDETTWTQIGTDSTYTLTSTEEGKKVRAILSYTDGQGFAESVTTSTIDINQKTYSLSTEINSPQEGYELTTTASTENVSEGSTLYWSLSGTNISITDFASGSLTGSGTVGSDGTFSFKHSIANDGETEGYETIDIKLFSDSDRTTQVGETKSILIRDSAIEEKIAEIVEDLNGVKQVVSQLVKGQNYTLNNIRDYDGNLHANSADEDVSSSYKYQHALDVNGDGTLEAIYTNMKSGRWVTASINPLTGKVDYSDYGQDGTTRVVGIYDDPLIAEGAQNNGYLSDGVTPAPANFGVSDADRYVQYNGETVDRLALNSQVRFQNDLKIDNLIAKKSNDFDSDGIREVYWKTSDGTAYLRALMHADGNIRYANYQSESQMTDYLTTNGLSDSITEIIS